MTCWLCYGPPPEVPCDEHGGVKVRLAPAELCAGHRDELRAMAATYEAKHPDGRCPPGRSCGCMTRDELPALGMEEG